MECDEKALLVRVLLRDSEMNPVIRMVVEINMIAVCDSLEVL